MNKPKQKKFTARFEIEAAIIKTHRDLAKLDGKAAGIEREIKRLKVEQAKSTEGSWQAFLGEKISQNRKEYGDICTRMEGIRVGRMKRLQDALAAFQTETFAFMEGDKTVVLQSR